MKTIRLSLLLSLFSLSLHAQGEWRPANGTFVHPRTLTSPVEVDVVREIIGVKPLGELFTSLWYDVWGKMPPQENGTSNGRRGRAGFAKNAAFVLLVDRGISGSEVQPLDPAERAAIRETLLELLRTINPDVETALEYTEWQWRSKELIDYLCAYDMALGAGVPKDSLVAARNLLQDFAGNLHREATLSVAGLSFFTTIKNNHALMTAAALGMAAVVLNDVGDVDPNRQPQSWIKTALWNIDNLFWRDESRRLSEPGVIAGYAEGPHYLRYASLNLLPFFRSLGHVLPDGEIGVDFNGSERTIRHPFHDPDYELLWEWIYRLRTPEGLLPPLEDTFVNEGFPELALTGEQKYVWPITSNKTTLQRELHSTVDMRANFLAAGIVPKQTYEPHHLVAMPEAGNLIFRLFLPFPSHTLYFHMSGEHGLPRESGGGHNQADAGSFMLGVGGEMMALDPGYVGYDRREEVGKAANHNMILVDGDGPAIGTPGAANDADAWIGDTFNLDDHLGFGSVTTGYRGAKIRRDVLFLDLRTIVIADFLTSDEEHEYTWQLHGNGLAGEGPPSSGLFLENFDDREAMWYRDGHALSTHIAASDGSTDFRAETAPHEVAYDSTENHTVLRLRSAGKDRQFLSALVPRSLSNDQELESTVEEGSTTMVTRLPDHTVITVGADTTFRTVSPLATALPGEIGTDAPLALLRIEPFSGFPTKMFMRNGKTLSYDGRELLSSSVRTDLAIVPGTSGYQGYCKDSGFIFIGIDFIPHEVTGKGVREWHILWATGRIAIDLQEGGYFSMLQGLTADDPNIASRETRIAGIRRLDDEHLFLEIAGTTPDEMEIAVFDLTGRRILPDSDSPILPVAELPEGVYIIALFSEGRRVDSRKYVMVR